MKTAAFSTSLAVQDLAAPRAFYEDLGFEAMGGDADQGLLILKSGPTIIGLFQGMFEQNLLTFNPGWNQNAEAQDPFEDVRDIASKLRNKGHELAQENLPEGGGPGSFTVTDPDGNIMLVDQHR
ncbi:MAG: VOC family protein [Rhodobacteraceae bacterium]|nr:VOC family protein [Paracoccaceae bacterium]